MARRIPTLSPDEPWDSASADTWRREVRNSVNGWESAAPALDWVPEGPDQWIGDLDRHPRGVAVGTPTGDAQAPGIEGALVNRTNTSSGVDGGVVVVGFRGATPDGSDPELIANAPVVIAGSDVLLTGAVWVEVAEPLASERYLLLGTSDTLADGRHIAPLIVGPQYFPTLEETATDVRDIALDGVGGDEVVATLGPLANTYTAGVSSFFYAVRLSEEGGHVSAFDVSIWRDSGGGYTLAVTDEYDLTGAAQNARVSIPLASTINAGESIQMRVSAVNSNPNSDPWVRGSVVASELSLRQG